MLLSRIISEILYTSEQMRGNLASGARIGSGGPGMVFG